MSLSAVKNGFSINGEFFRLWLHLADFWNSTDIHWLLKVIQKGNSYPHPSKKERMITFLNIAL
jgi:hypothetical protein